MYAKLVPAVGSPFHKALFKVACHRNSNSQLHGGMTPNKYGKGIYRLPSGKEWQDLLEQSLTLNITNIYISFHSPEI